MDDPMEIKVRILIQYGTRRVHPANERAERFAKLTGRKTFSDADLETIKALGYVVTVIPETL